MQCTAEQVAGKISLPAHAAERNDQACAIHRSTYLGGGHTDLVAGVEVHAAVGGVGDGAAHRVGDAHAQGTLGLLGGRCGVVLRSSAWWMRAAGVRGFIDSEIQHAAAA